MIQNLHSIVLTTFKQQKLTNALVVRKTKELKFCVDREQTGKCWLRRFLEGNSDQSLRKQEEALTPHSAGFNKISVGWFFELLGKTLNDHAFSSYKIYNSYESGKSVVSITWLMVIVAAQKTSTTLISTDRGIKITVEFRVNTAGLYMPSMFIFIETNETLPNSRVECSDLGWITTEIFLEWFT